MAFTSASKLSRYVAGQGGGPIPDEKLKLLMGKQLAKIEQNYERKVRNLKPIVF